MSNIPAKKVQGIIKKERLSSDERLKEYLNEHEVEDFIPYVRADGTILLVDSFEGTGILYNDLHQLQNVIGQDVESKSHVMEGLILDAKYFLKNIDSLIFKLANGLEIDEKKLDKTVSSLSLIDSAINKLGIENFEEMEMHINLVAYIGEVMKTNTGGEWLLKKENDIEVWEPWIKVTDKNLKNPFLMVFKEFDEEVTVSFKAGVEFELSDDRLSIE